MSNKKELYIKYCNILYMIILAAFITHTYFDNTTYVLPWPDQYYELLRIAMVGIVLIKFGLNDAWTLKEVSEYFVFWLIFALAAYKTGYVFLIEIAFLVLGAKDIPFNSIAKMYLLISSFVFLTAFLGSIFGVIPNYIFYKGTEIKNSFGIIYSTDFAAHILFNIIVYTFLRGKKVGYLECFLIGLLGIAVYKYSRARMNFGAIIIVACLIAAFRCLDKYIKEDSWQEKLQRIVEILMALSFIICSSVSILLTKFYNPQNVFFQKLNSLLSTRLSLGKSGLEKYGVTLFGSPFELIGTNYIVKEGYNFIDSSYVLIMLRYGVLVLILLIVAFTLLSFKAVRLKNRGLLIALFVIAFQCMIEHHFLEINYNIFLLLPFSFISNGEEQKATEVTKKQGFMNIFLAAVFLLTIIKKNSIISYFRTLASVLKLNDSKKQVLFVAFCFLVWLLVIALFYSYRHKIKTRKVIAALSIISFFIMFCGMSYVVQKEYEVYGSELFESAKKLYTLDLDDINIYVEDMPFYYEKNGMNILPGVPYATEKEKCIAIVRDYEEQSKLLSSGYQCARINKYEYLYTNDDEVINRLKEQKIDFKAYHDYLYQVDLKKMAEYNHLKDVNGRITLSGPQESIYCGPWATVYKGKIRVLCDLNLIKADPNNSKIATFCVTQNNGAKEIMKYEIKKEDFLETGEYLLEIEKEIGDISDLEFKIYVEEGSQLQLNSIEYLKVG